MAEPDTASVWSARPRLGRGCTVAALLLCSLPVASVFAAPEEGVADTSPAEQQAPTPESEPCPGAELVPDIWLDQLQRGVYSGMCHARAWFDGLFGGPAYDPQAEDVSGRLGFSTFWDQRDGLKLRFRLKARMPLPAFENKVRLLVGVGDQRQLIQDRRPGPSETLPTAFRDVNDSAWLLGLGYSPGETLDHGFDFSAGVRLHIPPDPFVKGRYHYNLSIGEHSVARLQETLFWQNTHGFGETTQGDLDRLLSDRFLVRWSNSATAARDTEGLNWSSALTLYQSVAERRSMAYTVFVQGETAGEVPLQDLGVQVRYRRSVLREWLFIEASASVTWPRLLLTEERKVNPGGGLAVDMYFGHVNLGSLR